MKISNFKFKDILEYLLIIAMFFITGGAFSYMYYSVQIIAFFAISLLFCLLFGKNIMKNLFVVLVVFSIGFFLIIPGICFDIDNISSYIAIILQMCAGLFCASFISIKNFKAKYVNVITAFALISLIFFVAGTFKPSIALLFPPIDNVEGSSVKYYNAFVYVFMEAKGYYSNIVLLKRNAGICWEPGCYQMFLNVALLFLFDKKTKFFQPSFYIKFVILITTIITTVSTTGYLLMLLIILIEVKNIVKKTKTLIFIYLGIALLFCGFLFTPLGRTFAEKITNEFLGVGTTRQNILDRTSIGAIGYIFTNSRFVGMGFSKWLAFEYPLYNSIIHSFLCLGTPFSLLHLSGLFFGCKRMSTRYILLFVIVVLCSSTETLFWRIMFNTFAFYGWLGFEETLSKIAFGGSDINESITFCRVDI